MSTDDHVATRTSPPGLLVLASLVWCAILAWVLVWVLLTPPHDPPPGGYSRPLALVGAAVLAAGLPALAVWGRPLVDRLEARPLLRRALLVAVTLACGAFIVRTGMSIHMPNGWDAGQIETVTYNDVHGTLSQEWRAHGQWLVDQYPNNALLVALLTAWFGLCAAVGFTGAATGAALLNAAVMTASLVLLYLTARRVAGAGAGYLAGLAALPLVVVSPWAGTAYSDTLGMVFPIGIAYFFVLSRTASSALARAGCWAAVGCLTAVGIQIKPTVLFAALAALAAAALAVRLARPGRTQLLGAGAAAAGLVLGAVLGNGVVGLAVDRWGISASPAAEELGFPFTHFLMMGAQGAHHQYGAYSSDDVALTKSIPADERFQHGLDRYVERVREMGPGGYAWFLHRKANWMYGDGSFFAYGEASYRLAPTAPEFSLTDPVSRTVQGWLGHGGEHYGITLGVWQAAWIAVLALVAAPILWRRRELFGAELTMMRLALLALTVFLLLFEGRARYLYLYLPVFLVLASASAVSLAAGWRARRGMVAAGDAPATGETHASEQGAPIGG